MTLLSPFFLFTLLLLPCLWWLVRALPPRPRQQTFPSLVLLRKLTPARQNAAHTPLWLLFLRLIALTLLIFAFSRPLYIPPHTSAAPKNLILILDNGWASFPHWAERQHTALALGEATLRAGGHVTLLTTAQEIDGHAAMPISPPNSTTLQHIITQISPQLWPVDRLNIAHMVQQLPLHGAEIVLLSDGVSQGGEDTLRTSVQPAAHITDIRWPRCDLLRLKSSYTPNLTLLAEALPGCPPRSVRLVGMTLEPQNQLASQTTITLSTQTPHIAKNLLPEAEQYDAFNLPDMAGPAGITLLAGHSAHYRIGLLHLNGDNTPLTGSNFYLKEALHEGFTFQEGTFETLTAQRPNIIFASDGTITDATSADILTWVRQGGVLVRFAGAALAHQSQQDIKGNAASLLPVPLLSGMRQLGGPMSWGTPQQLAPFPPNSPFTGLNIPHDATVSRQVLAQPTDDLSSHVWATLTDGTPLVTARREGNGLIVLFHITPTADWSNLPLSGLFPQMLERLVTRAPIAQHGTVATPDATHLVPWRIIDAQKTLSPPFPTTRPLMTLDTQHVDVFHPEGFYGEAQQRQPLNMADHQPPLRDEPTLGELQQAGHPATEHPFWPALLLASLALVIVDMCLSLYRYGLLRLSRPTKLGLSLLLLSGITLAAPTYAASPGDGALPAASSTVPPAALAIRLAHIETGDANTDSVVQQGLEGLTQFLNQRSTTHLDSPVSVVPGRDDLAFYPLLYWPITAQTHLDAAAKAALKDYIQHNGMLLIDEMGAGSALDGSDGHTVRQALKEATEGLPIPPLTVLNDQHTLTHSFYLLHDFPGRIAGQPVYVARQDNEDSEDVSPVIIGNGDWAHAWAIDQTGEHPFAVIPDGETQRTLAYRFGFNAIIYALTGNYKNDQRHYPEMLKRLKNGDNAATDTPPEEGDLP